MFTGCLRNLNIGTKPLGNHTESSSASAFRSSLSLIGCQCIWIRSRPHIPSCQSELIQGPIWKEYYHMKPLQSTVSMARHLSCGVCKCNWPTDCYYESRINLVQSGSNLPSWYRSFTKAVSNKFSASNAVFKVFSVLSFDLFLLISLDNFSISDHCQPIVSKRQVMHFRCGRAFPFCHVVSLTFDMVGWIPQLAALIFDVAECGTPRFTNFSSSAPLALPQFRVDSSDFICNSCNISLTNS